MTSGGPLNGLRVIDLTGDLGRFATRLLAELGAGVYRPVGAGSRGRPMEGRAGDFGGVLDWWYDWAKVPIALDLTTDAGRDHYRTLAASADLIVESQPVGFLADHGIDHQHLVAGNPRLAQVSLTPFGRTGPRSGWQTSDLVSGALGGVLSLTGLPDEPLNSWGWQNYNFGGMCAALCGLAAVRAARTQGRGQLVDLSLHEVVTGSIENLFMQYLYDDLLDLPKLAPRQGSLHWLGAYQVAPARTGNVMITPTPQPEPLVEWMISCDVAEAEPFAGRPVEELVDQMPELMAAIRAFVATRDAGDLFVEAQGRHIAFGEVQSVAQVAQNPQLAHRGFLAPVELDDGSEVAGPWRLVRFSDTPVARPELWPDAAADPGAIADQWAAAPSPLGGSVGGSVAGSVGRSVAGAGSGAETEAKPLDGLVVVDLSWVLAGPFATRLLGDLGAHVIKVQTEERATLVNQPDYPYYAVWNRSKRSVTLNLKHPDGPALARGLMERADVVVENYSAGVLDRLGLGWDAAREWNDQLVYISMSGCGHDGPWKDIISYAPTVHALCGLTHLTNPAGRGDLGCGFSLNDHAAGFSAALCVLAAVEARRRTGRGQYLDMAQLEIGAYLLGPAMVDYLANGREAQPAGNVDALADAVPNDVFRCGDGRFLAITAVDDEMWWRLAPVVGLDPAPWATVAQRRAARHEIGDALSRWCRQQQAGAAMERLQASGVAAGAVQDAEDLAERDPQLQARRFWLDADHDVFGRRRHDRFPALWSGSELEPYRPAPPYLGEANFEIWTDLVGLDPAEVAEGIASGLFT
jgi:crotonobetainyl-CoA:carnitine CoA-transferase CaiB-like acyl-CoA transferase